MVRPMSQDDFRATRHVLEKDDFALSSDEPDPPPADLIDPGIWHHITDLPDDVLIRTTDRFGRLIRYMNEVCSAWIFAIRTDSRDPINSVMLDCVDDFDAAVYNSIHGFYRQAIGSMRSVVELICIGAFCQLHGRGPEFLDWRKGKTEIKFGAACDLLPKAPPINTIESRLNSKIGDSLFRPMNGAYPGGWVRRLYSELSNYLHSRPRHTNGALWQSNGPIFVPKAFGLAAELLFETSALCFVIVKTCWPDIALPEPYYGLPHFAKHNWKRVCKSTYSIAKKIS